MKIFNLSLKPQQIVSKSKGEAHFINEVELNNVAELRDANQNSVCFYENIKYIEQLKKSKAGLIFVPKDFDVLLKSNTNLILIDKPYISFMMLVKHWLKISSPLRTGKIANTSIVPDSVKLGKDVVINDNVILGEHVTIGSNTIIEGNSVIQNKVEIGSNCHIFHNTTIYEECIIKNNVVIHAGCVIGSDGFGYVFHEGIQNKIPQVGNVIVEDDVEIGANSTIDRATIGSTIIGKGTKIDNLVQVGHNCIIGENSILCAQVGLAGSTIIGDVVYLAGQVGVAGHLKINDRAMVGAQSGVSNSIPENAKYFGTPAIDARLKKRVLASEKKLPDLVRYFRNKSKDKG